MDKDFTKNTASEISVLSISFDRGIFNESSEPQNRVISQGKKFKEIHVIVFSKFGSNLKPQKLAENIWIYPTNSLSRFLHIHRAKSLGRKILKGNSGSWIVTAQDPFESGLSALEISKEFSIPFYVQVHTDFLSPWFSKGSFFNKLRLAISRDVLSEADGIRVVSKRVRDSIIDSDIKIKCAIDILPVYVESNYLEGNLKSDFLSKKYPDFKFIILTVSRLSKEKDIETAIKVLANVSGKYFHAGLVVVGNGREESRLKRVASNLGVADRVIFEGEVKHVDLWKYYASANIFLQTSLFEGFGRSLVEATLLKCPFLSTDVGIASDLVCGDVSVCKVRDEECLSFGIMRFINDGNLRVKKSQEALENLEKIIILDKEKYLNSYADLLVKTYGRKIK